MANAGGFCVLGRNLCLAVVALANYLNAHPS
jgi:hypothetical protein